jgi:DnaJ-class molecular chaperone
MSKYEQITAARRLLELPERASMEDIKANYRNLVNAWHPDRCDESKEKCTEMTAKIISAYRTLIDYCNSYRFSFSEDEIRHHLSDQEWWFERFGDTPLWEK